MTPNAIKSNKVYSIIPSNGNGDLTFTRDTAATQINSLGNVENVLTTIPRLNYDSVGGCPSLLLEPQRTNLKNYSDSFSVLGWVRGAGVTYTDNQLSPQNINNALLAEELNGTGLSGGAICTITGLSISGNTNYTFSVYAKLKTASANNFRLRVKSNISSTNFYKEQALTTTSWTRVTLTVLIPIGDTSIDLAIGTLSGALDVYLWGAQLEQGAYPTSYIPTTTSAATRNQDVFSRNNIYTNGLITSAGGTWFIELNNNLSLLREAGVYSLFLADTLVPSNGLIIRNSTSTSQRLSISKRINAVTETSLFLTLTNTVKIAIKWNGTTADVFVNGVKEVISTSFSTTNMEFLKANTADVPKYIKSTMLFPTPLTDTECINLTTL